MLGLDFRWTKRKGFTVYHIFLDWCFWHVVQVCYQIIIIKPKIESSQSHVTHVLRKGSLGCHLNWLPWCFTETLPPWLEDLRYPWYTRNSPWPANPLVLVWVTLCPLQDGLVFAETVDTACLLLASFAHRQWHFLCRSNLSDVARIHTVGRVVGKRHPTKMLGNSQSGRGSLWFYSDYQPHGHMGKCFTACITCLHSSCIRENHTLALKHCDMIYHVLCT